MTHGEPRFLGFLAKKVCREVAELAEAGVREICSVSNCISSAASGRIDQWLHNDAGYYNSESDAWRVTPEGERAEYAMFAYRVLPVVFGEDGPSEDTVYAQEGVGVPIAGEPNLAEYSSIGYDVGSRNCTPFIECSPLSCNYVATELQVNLHCLLDDLHDAVALAEILGREEIGAEPGPYYVLEVLRKHSPQQ